MLKPSEVNPNASQFNAANLSAIEEQFDRAIKSAEQSGKWPAVVPSYRDNVTAAEIESVADSYRAEGWKIMTTSFHAKERAVIDHPSRAK